MSYEQLREQCAELMDEIGSKLQTDDKTNDYWMGVGAMVDAAEIAIRALPLPEVKQLQAPKEWANYDTTYVVNFIRETSHFDAPLIGEMLNFAIQSAKTTLPEVMNDAAALRKENEQLREEIEKSFNTGLRQGLITGADFARELYVNHCFHHGVNGLLLRCEEAEGKLYKMADEALKGGAA